VQNNLTFNGTLRDTPQGCFYLGPPGQLGVITDTNAIAPVSCTPALTTADVRTCTWLMPSQNCGFQFSLWPPGMTYELDGPLPSECETGPDQTGTPTFHCSTFANVDPTNFSMVFSQRAP
jgi:hypothetical protein